MKVMQIKLQKQNGIILISLVFIFSLMITGYLISHFNTTSRQLQQNTATLNKLGYAKETLLAWAVSNSNNFGQLPYPDRNTGGGYDGFSDCPPSNTPFNDPESYRLLIGKLPVYGQTHPCIKNWNGFGLGENEYEEKRFWYAVSRNIVHQYEYLITDIRSDPIINPSLIDHPTYPWMKVFDVNGNLISDRVAVVIIDPGNAIGDQSRSDTATIENYLDSFVNNGVSYSNQDYDSPDEDFFQHNAVNNQDSTLTINDQLVFITIDELINALEKRVGLEAVAQLNRYHQHHSSYPFAASLGAHDENGIPFNETGMLPFDLTNQCNCQLNQCNCRFDRLKDVKFTRNDGQWTKSNQNCSRRLSTCTCSGAGSCSVNDNLTENIFTCDSSGTCMFLPPKSTNIDDPIPTGQFTFTLAEYENIYPSNLSAHSNGSCSNSSLVAEKIVFSKDEINCKGTGEFIIANSLWKNKWQDFLYYHYSPSGQLQVNDETNINAIVISTGKPITVEPFTQKELAQERIAPFYLNDYLDTLENFDGNEKYISGNMNTTKTNNDKLFIVKPNTP
jgi:hypothetical protein